MQVAWGWQKRPSSAGRCHRRGTGKDGEILSQNHNRREELKDTAHAEILVLREAGVIRSWRLLDTTLYVTWNLARCVPVPRAGKSIPPGFGARDPQERPFHFIIFQRIPD